MQTGIPPKESSAIELDPYRSGQISWIRNFIPYMSGLYTTGNSTYEAIKVGDTTYHRDYAAMLPTSSYYDQQLVLTKVPVYALDVEVSYKGSIYFTLSLIVHTKVHRLQLTNTSGGGGPGLDFYFSFEYYNTLSTMYDDDAATPAYFAALDEEVNITKLEHIGYDYFQLPVQKTDQKPLDLERPSPSSIEVVQLIEEASSRIQVTKDPDPVVKPRFKLLSLFRRKKGIYADLSKK